LPEIFLNWSKKFNCPLRNEPKILDRPYMVNWAVRGEGRLASRKFLKYHIKFFNYEVNTNYTSFPKFQCRFFSPIGVKDLIFKFVMLFRLQIIFLQYALS